MKNMTLTLIDKKYTVEMDSHEYIKYLAYKLGIPVSNNKEPQTLRQYYADFVEIFSVRLSSNSKVMTVKEIQEYAEALYTISMMFDLGKTEELTPMSEVMELGIAGEQFNDLLKQVIYTTEYPDTLTNGHKCKSLPATYINKENITIYGYGIFPADADNITKGFWLNANGNQIACSNDRFTNILHQMNSLHVKEPEVVSTKKTDYCTYIPSLDIYVKDYGTSYATDPSVLWYINQFDTKMEVSMDDYTIISETIEMSKKSQAIH